jgi:hypothetical protein
LISRSDWFKSSRSSGGSDSCVEVRITDVTVGVRDTKDRKSGSLELTARAWEAFLGTQRD